MFFSHVCSLSLLFDVIGLPFPRCLVHETPVEKNVKEWCAFDFISKEDENVQKDVSVYSLHIRELIAHDRGFSHSSTHSANRPIYWQSWNESIPNKQKLYEKLCATEKSRNQWELKWKIDELFYSEDFIKICKLILRDHFQVECLACTQ